MNYKDNYNEWASNHWVDTGKDPSLYESEKFWDSWKENQFELADYLRKGEMEEA